ncbi:hypothetical protein D0X99_18785 [Algoriphagus lacus]|uniref:Uncharacterized protein n=1 Tax=Algoriphagus lacus TaxID=2056311 RepID=A0A418PLZ4_9BACT|nr:hypothetical protein [Algoriphagus lacus]RIW12559.1 hypothetical protein D0X99_18785 [Algoriphagus lacus]
MRTKLILSAIILISLAACEKDDNLPGKLKVKEGPLSNKLGKLIDLGDYGYGRFVVWGRNSDELFITASSEILRIDISSNKVYVLDTKVGSITSKTNENSGIVFINQSGYNLFNFSTNSIENLISTPSNQGSLLNISGNNIFYTLFPVSKPATPCSGFCWPAPGPFVPATFYHIDKQTQKITDLKNKRFLVFSQDGSKTILSSQIESRMFVFDNVGRTIIDSADVKSTNPKFGLFFQRGVLQSYDVDILGKITIKNFKTDEIIKQFSTNMILSDEIKVSADGTKLYYSGGVLNGNSMKILLYDIATNTQTELVDIPFLDGVATPVDFFLLSDDNRKLVTRSGNDLYVKVLN